MKWYKYDIRDLSEEEYDKWYSLMSEDKQQRVDRFRYIEDKKRTVAGEMLARQAIARWCDVKAESIVFDTAKYGKPFAVGLNVEFNISHSGDMVVCAIDKHPVGIDIEQIRTIDLNIVKRICTDEELVCLFGHEPKEDDFEQTPDIALLTRFFEIWTAKEAYYKCIGTGIYDLKISPPKNTITFKIDEDYIVSVVRQ